MSAFEEPEIRVFKVRGANIYSDPVEGETRMSKILLNGNNICMVQYTQLAQPVGY